MTITMKNKLSANTNEVGVFYEGSDATHEYYISNIDFEKFEDVYELQLALNSTSFGRGKFTVDVNVCGYCRITYTSTAMYGEASTDFAIDLEEKLSVFFE